ncbi:peptidyl-prolyl cis-trans isomerase [uncultured Sphingomonas sp.]|uniref:peptidylprolyl isomerase n=1 Tax=uncultured Sphingomonas sp. TaxID=158754 RepID=UPI0035CC684C
MLSFFRRIVSSRVGVIVTFGGLVLIAILFGLGDVTGFMSGGGGVAGSSVASVGGTDLASGEMRRTVDGEFQAAQAEQPTLTIAQFVDGGGVDAAVERAIAGLALETFGHGQKMAVSKKAADGQIASIPSLQGPDGKFDPRIYDQLLRARRLTDGQIRADIARQTIAQQLVAPTVGATQVPNGLVMPYASLLLEKRQGSLAFVPAAAMPAGAAASPAELQSYYAAHRIRYLVPERRAIRYALVTPATVAAQATPSDAEIAAAYQARKAEFLPTEKRTITQVSVLDQAAANAIAAKVKAGTSVAAAASAAGLAPQVLTATTKADYAKQATPALADAMFGAAKGAVVGPVRGTLGFVVAHVDSIEQVAGKSLDQARPDLVKTLAQTKTVAALGHIHDTLQDGIARHANVAELTADAKLTPVASAPLTAGGANPDQPEARPDPSLAPLLAAAFAAETGDDPQLVQTSADGSFAVVALDRVVPAAPRPFAQVQAQVAKDVTAVRQQRAARALAGQLLAKTNAGTPIAQAVTAAGASLPPVRPLTAIRAQLSQQRAAPPPLVLMFSMPPRTARVLEAPDGAGWYVVRLDTITAGDVRTEPRAVEATQGEFRRLFGREYDEQFSKAVQAQVGVKRNAAAIAQLKADLSGRGGNQGGTGGSDQ